MRVMDSTQLGRAGELALSLYGLVTSGGRLANHTVTSGREVLEFRASPDHDDAFAAFRLDPTRFGPALVTLIEAQPGSPPDWLRALAIQVLR